MYVLSSNYLVRFTEKQGGFMKRNYDILIISVFIILSLIVIGLEFNQRPTKAEVIAICKGDTTSIFHVNNASKLQSCLYTLILIEINELEGIELRQELENHVKWMVKMEELRSKKARKEFLNKQKKQKMDTLLIPLNVKGSRIIIGGGQ